MDYDRKTPTERQVEQNKLKGYNLGEAQKFWAYLQGCQEYSWGAVRTALGHGI